MGREGRRGDCVVQRHLGVVDTTGQIRKREQCRGLRIGETRTGVVAVAGYDDADRQLRDPERRLS